MKQLNQDGIEMDKFCNNMTTIDLGPDSTSSAVAMCACNSTNCNFGPPKKQNDDEMIGAMMPQTEIPNTLPLTGLLIDQCTIIELSDSTHRFLKKHPKNVVICCLNYKS